MLKVRYYAFDASLSLSLSSFSFFCGVGGWGRGFHVSNKFLTHLFRVENGIRATSFGTIVCMSVAIEIMSIISIIFVSLIHLHIQILLEF